MKDIICIDSKIFNNLLKKSLQNCQKTSNIFLRDPQTVWTYTPPTICQSLSLKKSNTLLSDKNTIRNNLLIPTLPSELKTIQHSNLVKNRLTSFADVVIPDNFSWVSSKILPVMDQGSCGDCWAYSTVATLADKYAIKYNIDAPDLSVLWTVTNTNYIINKTPAHYNCEGGRITDAISFFQNVGCKLHQCWPMDLVRNYSNQDIFPQPLTTLSSNCCYNCCNDQTVGNKIYYSSAPRYLSNINTNSKEDITKNIQLEIMHNGPVCGGFQVFTDFNYYWNSLNSPPGSVYIKNANPIPVENKYEGWHAIEITGWGKNEKGIRYWEFKNSWGYLGGQNGYGKMAFSLDIPDPNNWVYLDIPTSELYGGMVSFDPGHLPETSMMCSYHGVQTTVTDPNNSIPPITYCQCDDGYFGKTCQNTNNLCTDSGGIILNIFGNKCMCSNNSFVENPPFCKAAMNCQSFCSQYYSNNYNNCMMNCHM